MQFLDYKNNVEQILARKHLHMKDINVDMDAMFEAYINSVKPIDFIKSMYTLNESCQTDKFTDYYNKSQITELLETLDSVSLKVVLDLPTVGEQNIIYLVQ